VQLAQRPLKSRAALPVALVLHQVGLDAESPDHPLRSRLTRSPERIDLNDHRRSVGDHMLSPPLRMAALQGAYDQRFLGFADFLAGQ
jgi:hypothetical protein